jgi:hypothetical protein
MSTDQKKPTAAPAAGPQGLLMAGVVVTLAALAFIIFLIATGKGAGPIQSANAANEAAPVLPAPAAPAPPAGPPAQMPNRGELLPSGLRIETIREGRGPLVTRADTPLIRYELRVLGRAAVLETTFNEPRPGPVPVAGVIPGFGEALTRMRAGGEARFWVPPSLGYGASIPPGAPFGPNDILEFRVRVESIPAAGGAAGPAVEAGAPSNAAAAAR